MANAPFAVEVRPRTARRGENVEIVLTVVGPSSGAEDEAGLTCREWFQEVDESDDAVWVHKTVYEERARAHDRAGDRILSFVIPEDAAFTYTGTSVRYRWEAFVSRPRRLRRDARATAELDVLP